MLTFLIQPYISSSTPFLYTARSTSWFRLVNWLFEMMFMSVRLCIESAISWMLSRFTLTSSLMLLR